MNLTNMTSEELLSLRAAVSGELARRADSGIRSRRHSEAPHVESDADSGVVLTDDERALVRAGEHVKACKMVLARIKPDGLILRDAWRAVTAERKRVEEGA